MKTRISTLLAAALTLIPSGARPHPGQHDLDAERIGAAAGTKATMMPDGVVRIGWSRNDVAVKVDGMPLQPSAGLGSWAAFEATEDGAIVMGDTVVFEDEVTPGMDAAFAHGLDVTALHNHFAFDEPRVFFMHVGGAGKPDKLAAGIKAVWDAIKAVRAEHHVPETRFSGGVPTPGDLDAAAIGKILGLEPHVQDGVVKVSVELRGRMHGVDVGGTMGLSTWAAFSGADELAAVDGDFIMTAAEVQPVLHALRAADIHVVALHNHMIGEQPTCYFTHYWGKGPAQALARGVAAALEVQRRTSAAGR